MANRDYYNVLGVDRKASQDEIKKSYRQLAMRWHPDRNPSDPTAEQRFKDITEAYQVLGDPTSRSRYDRMGPLFNASGRPPRPDELNEVFSNMFGNIFRRRRETPGADDLRYTLSVTLEEVARGVSKRIVVPRQVRCTTCHGEGAAPEGKATCDVCGGTGRSTGPRLWRTECYHCEGRGFVIEQSCTTCSGDGRVGVDDALAVKVPAGVATGQKLKLKAKGNEPRGSGDAGELFVIVNVADHALFRRRGDDVLCELPLTYPEAALGAEVTVPTLEGTTTIRVPAGTPAGKIFRLAGRGLPKVGTSTKGDLHLQVVLEVPMGLSEPQGHSLRAWAEGLPEAVHPRRVAFDDAVKERR